MQVKPDIRVSVSELLESHEGFGKALSRRVALVGGDHPDQPLVLGHLRDLTGGLFVDRLVNRRVDAVRDIERVELLEHPGPELAHRNRYGSGLAEELCDSGRGRLVINRNPTSHIELAGHLRSQNPNIEQGHDHASSHIATEVSLGVRQKGLVTHVGLHARIGDDPVPVEPGTLEAVKGRDADVIVLVELGREESCLLAVARWAPACVAVPKERLSLGSVTH